MTGQTERERLLSLAEEAIEEALPAQGERPVALSEAMRYAVGSGGKRIRPLVCLGAAVAAGGRAEDALRPAAAIEILHNYTLVHDDLPAMDGDVERRGRPTVWKKFGEANAILAGDALLALAYGVAAKTPRNASAVVSALAEAGVGVVRGQVEDVIQAAGGTTPSPDDVDFVYRHKTADLFIAAAKMGALAAGADGAVVERLGDFALSLGLAFQYEDDVLDGDGLLSPEETARRASEATAAALAALEGLPGDTSFLKYLAESLLGRRS